MSSNPKKVKRSLEYPDEEDQPSLKKIKIDPKISQSQPSKNISKEPKNPIKTIVIPKESPQQSKKRESKSSSDDEEEEEDSFSGSCSSDREDPITGERYWEAIDRWPEKCSSCNCPFYTKVTVNGVLTRRKLNVGEYDGEFCKFNRKKSDDYVCECDDCCCGGCGTRKLVGKVHC